MMFSSIASILALSPLAFAGLTVTSQQNVAVYWGQNSYGQGTGNLSQQTLATYCKNSNIDVIQMAFMVQITSGTGGYPVLNFANQQNDCTTFPGTALINCPQIAADIVTCQKTYGKTILLSIGGATYTEGGFASAAAATAAANKVWAIFGPKQKGSTAPRPFGTSVIDGFDFDFETTVQNTVPFARQLRGLMGADKSKKYFITAAPQCPYPDAADSPMLQGEIFFDAIFVQFYNNYCGLQSYVAGSSTQNNFNFGTWDNWAKNVSKNKAVKVFLGVPAGPSGAGSGYEALTTLQGIIKYCKGFSSFGGVMAWDASQAYSQPGFLAGIKSTLKNAAKKKRHVKDIALA